MGVALDAPGAGQLGDKVEPEATGGGLAWFVSSWATVPRVPWSWSSRRSLARLSDAVRCSGWSALIRACRMAVGHELADQQLRIVKDCVVMGPLARARR